MNKLQQDPTTPEFSGYPRELYYSGRMSGENTEAQHVVVVGGGVIGAAIAYYLTEHGCPRVTVIERTGIASHASGKAGGFLAKDWGGSHTSQLHQLSFDLLADLARTLPLPSYRKLPTLSLRHRAGRNVASWLDGDHVSSSSMDPDTAQVTPFELTHALMDAARGRGAEVKIATVTGLLRGPDGAVTGVTMAGGETLAATDCVIAMGVWSTLLGDWLGASDRFPMEGIRSSSLIFRDPVLEKLHTQEPYAVFSEDDAHGCHLELYPRPEGEVYVCGLGGSDHIRGARLREGGDCASSDLILPNAERVQIACDSLSRMTSHARHLAPAVTQACMRPCPPDALPMIGAIPDVPHLFVAAGHNCWGILWSAATGLVMSELIMGRSPSLNLKPFAPTRFSPSK